MIATIEATPNQQLLDAYDNYTNAGLAVVPLNGKTPKVKSWQKKTFSLDDFTAAIATYDDPGLGVRLGPDSGIIDLEYDTPEQLEAIRAIVGDDLLETCPAFESTKGKHFLFAWDDRLEATNAANLNIPCGDGDTLIVRLGAADKGSQSAFPPSPGKSWLPGRSILEVDPPALPVEAIDELLKYSRGPDAVLALDPVREYSDEEIEACRTALAKLPDAIEGANGSAATLRAACEVRRFRIYGDDGFDLFQWYAENKCSPPWDYKQRLHKWNDAAKKEPAIALAVDEFDDLTDGRGLPAHVKV